MAGESGGFGEMGEPAGEAQVSAVERVLEGGEEEPAEHPRQNPNGQEEAGFAGDPLRLIR